MQILLEGESVIIKSMNRFLLSSMIVSLAAIAGAQEMDMPDTGYRAGLSSNELRLKPGVVAAATSFLPDAKDAARYAPEAAFDEKIETSWVEGNPGDGVGEKIGFAKFATVKMVKILPGYGTAAHFSRNNRVKRATLSVYEIKEEVMTQDGLVYAFGRLAKKMDLNFRDEMSMQELPVGVTARSAKGYLCVLEIKDVFRGSACRDTCIAEIRVLE